MGLGIILFLTDVIVIETLRVQLYVQPKHVFIEFGDRLKLFIWSTLQTLQKVIEKHLTQNLAFHTRP